MTDLSGIQHLKTKGAIKKVAPKPIETTSKPQELHKLDIEMEQADHAFALMMEIRERIETAYNELTPPRE